MQAAMGGYCDDRPAGLDMAGIIPISAALAKGEGRARPVARKAPA